MSAATEDTCASRSYQARSIGACDSWKLADRQPDQLAGRLLGQAALGVGARASASSSGGNSVRAARNRSTEACSSASKKRRSSGTRTLTNSRNGLAASSSGRPAGRRSTPPAPGSRGVAQVVEVDRVHAERRQHGAEVVQLGRRADPHRAVPLAGDPGDGPEPLGRVRPLAQHGRVDLRGGVHELLVRRDLGGVELGQSGGEAAPQLGAGRHVTYLRSGACGSRPRYPLAAGSRPAAGTAAAAGSAAP
jgi:hypothetical protein